MDTALCSGAEVSMSELRLVWHISIGVVAFTACACSSSRVEPTASTDSGAPTNGDSSSPVADSARRSDADAAPPMTGDSAPPADDDAGIVSFHVIDPVPNHLRNPAGRTPLLRTYMSSMSNDGSVLIGGSQLFDAPDGSIVGEGSESFRWTATSGTVGLGFLPECDRHDPFVSRSEPSAMSSDGSVLLGSCIAMEGDVQTSPLFRWTQPSGLVRIDGPPGLPMARWSAISADGSVAIGAADSWPLDPTRRSQAFRWTQTKGAVALGTLPGADSSDPYGGMTPDGATVVGISGDDIFRWTEATGMVALPRPSGFERCVPTLGRANVDPTLISGRCTDATSSQYFLWMGTSAPKAVTLPPGGVAEGEPAVALGGTVVFGTFRDATDRTRGFRWTPTSGATDLGFDGYEACSVSPGVYVGRSASENGKVLMGNCGTELDGGTIARKAFRWTEGSGIVALAPLPGDDGTMSDSLSADGSVITGVSVDSRDPVSPRMVGVSWDAGGKPTSLNDRLTSLGIDLQGFKIVFVFVSPTDRHLFFGTGTTREGEMRAWVARLP
jgi:probable HAF family extracellular repeat protein